ncbi:Uncharacterised protein [Vibrio cholerae]|nr:Uncharacterised protein [Vibrio cholerae]
MSDTNQRRERQINAIKADGDTINQNRHRQRRGQIASRFKLHHARRCNTGRCLLNRADKTLLIRFFCELRLS